MSKTKNPTYTVGYFIRKFQNIPTWKWIVGDLNGSRTWGNQVRSLHCALGFCDPGSESTELHCLFKKLGLEVVVVNDIRKKDASPSEAFRAADTPKERIVGALKAIRSKQRKAKKAA